MCLREKGVLKRVSRDESWLLMLVCLSCGAVVLLAYAAKTSKLSQ